MMMKKLSLLFALLMWATAANAQVTFTVSAATDNGTGAPNTLSAAINSANAYNSAGDITINFTVPTVSLSGSALPDINQTLGKRITFNGLADSTTVTRTSATAFRLFTITANDTVAMNKLILTNGNATTGGAIEVENTAQLTMTDCHVSGNAAVGGGGINSRGISTLFRCTFNGNTSSIGGGVFNFGGVITLTNCTISNNTASSFGGGIANDGTITATACRIFGNTTNTFEAGGGFDNSGGPATFTNCLFYNNTAPNGNNNGGGVFVFSGNTTLVNCTIANNSAGGAASAGGVFRFGGTCTVRNCLIVNNTGAGGNIAGTIAQTTNQTTNGAYFHSPTNYHMLPNAVGVIGAGTLGGITPATDLIGTPRPAPPNLSPSIGAYEAVAATPLFTNTAAASGGSLNTTLGATGVSLNLTGVLPATASFTAQQYDGQPQGSPFITAATSTYYWVIATNATAIGGGTATFDWSGIINNGGVINPATVQLLRRDGYGAPFTSLLTGGSGTSIGLSGVTAFSEFALGGVGDNPLPVEISLFTGNASSNGVSLGWKTESETNNAGFSILRDGAVIATYPAVSTLRGQGTSATASNYSFVDATVEAGRYMYSLRSHDLSGEVYDYLPTVSVEVRQTPVVRYDYSLAQNYPNPFNPGTTIQFTMKSAGQAILTIVDMLGRTVLTETLNAVAGVNQYRFNGAKLTSGTYFYQLRAAGFSETRKMVLVK